MKWMVVMHWMTGGGHEVGMEGLDGMMRVRRKLLGEEVENDQSVSMACISSGGEAEAKAITHGVKCLLINYYYYY